jgi:hypothetical protein
VFGLEHPVNGWIVVGMGIVWPPFPPEPPQPSDDVPVLWLPGALIVSPHPINKAESIAGAVMPAECRKELQATVAHRMIVCSTLLTVILRNVVFLRKMLTKAFIDRRVGSIRLPTPFCGSPTGATYCI